VVLRHEERPDDLIHRIARDAREDAGEKVAHPEPIEDLRTYGVGAQILLDLGVRRMRVLSAPKRLHGLSGFRLEVVEYVS
jgi:3,4-dihydroxy 2-butanone 4-phosphate synthase/GTP cyclohydrolase II